MASMQMDWGTFQVCEDRRAYASVVDVQFVDSHGTDPRMWDGVVAEGVDPTPGSDKRGQCQRSYSQAARTIAGSTIFQKAGSKKAGHMPAAETPDTFEGQGSRFIDFIERTACD